MVNTFTPNLDEKAGNLTTSNDSHRHIHEGNFYSAKVADTSMTVNDTLRICFKTPNTTKWMHMLADYTGKAAGYFSIVEGATWTASTGTQLVPRNGDRNSTNTTGALEDTTGTFTASKVLYNPTGYSTVAGTTIVTVYNFAAKSVLDRMRDEEELVLDQNQTYAFEYRATAASNAGELHLNWYEVTNR